MVDQERRRSVFNPMDNERLTQRASLCEMTTMAFAFMTLISINQVNIFINVFEVKDAPVWKLLSLTGLSVLGYSLGAIFPIALNGVSLQGCWCLTVIPNAIAFVLSFYHKHSESSAMYFGIVFTVAVSEGFLFPTIHIMIANVTQPRLRSLVTSIVYSGTFLGSTFGILTYNTFLVWQIVVRLFMLSIFCVNCNVIGNSLDNTEELDTKIFVLLCRKIFTSKPFIANIIANSCCVCSVTVLDIMGGIPFNPPWVPTLCSWISVILFGGAFTYYGCKNTQALVNSRKIAVAIASCIPIIYLIFWASTGGIKSKGLKILTMILMASYVSGTVTNIIDIAPNYAGYLIVVIQILEKVTLSMTLIPLYHLLGEIMMDDYWIQFWVILAAIVSSVMSVILFCCWATVEEQSWNKPKVNSLELTSLQTLSTDT